MQQRKRKGLQQRDSYLKGEIREKDLLPFRTNATHFWSTHPIIIVNFSLVNGFSRGLQDLQDTKRVNDANIHGNNTFQPNKIKISWRKRVFNLFNARDVKNGWIEMEKKGISKRNEPYRYRESLMRITIRVLQRMILLWSILPIRAFTICMFYFPTAIVFNFSLVYK